MPSLAIAKFIETAPILMHDGQTYLSPTNHPGSNRSEATLVFVVLFIFIMLFNSISADYLKTKFKRTSNLF